MKKILSMALGLLIVLPGCTVDKIEMPEVVINRPTNPRPHPRPHPRPRPRPIPRPILLPMHQVLPHVSPNAGQHFAFIRKGNIRRALVNLRRRMLSHPNTLRNQNRFRGIMNNWNRRAERIGNGVWQPIRKGRIYNNFMNGIRNVRL